jgi:hypothetical protein
MLNFLMRCSKVEGGIWSLAAAPFWPDTRPRLPASASSMICRSRLASSSASADSGCCGKLILSLPAQPSFRESGLASTARCSEEETASAAACCSGQILLGCDAGALVRMEAGIDPGPAGDSCSLASGGLHDVLEWLSRHRTGGSRKCVSKELRELIFRMVAENRTWGAPRIHGELKMLGFDISRSELFCVGCGRLQEIPNQRSAGRRF